MCSAQRENCSATRCCADQGLTCFQRDLWWSERLKECRMGSIDKTENKKWLTRWSCGPSYSKSQLKGMETRDCDWSGREAGDQCQWCPDEGG
mmetsp:Transcript_38247/g.118954  ORF Transcript_38247/g.118954 Transcript_38247/m.118954 type:complete len:92 (+) Transcript_38247:251-526(+)